MDDNLLYCNSYIEWKELISLQKKVRDIVKFRKISLACLLIGMFINILNYVFVQSSLVYITGFLFFIFFAITFFFWKCPKCKERLPFRLNIDTDVHDYYRCPYCETKFLDGYIVE